MIRWMLLCLATLLVMLAVSRVRASVSYADGFLFSVRFWFFRFPRVRPKRGGPQKQPRAQKTEKRRKGKTPAFVPDWSFFLSHFSETAELLLKLLRAVGRRVTVNLFLVDLRVRGDDAADTAIRYGQACGVVYTAAGALRSLVRVRRCEVSVIPLFQGGEAGATVQVELSMRVFSILTLLIARGPDTWKLFLAFLRASREKAERGQKHNEIQMKDGATA